VAKNLEITLPADRGILRKCDVAQRVTPAVVEGNAILILDLSRNRHDVCCRITPELACGRVTTKWGNERSRRTPWHRPSGSTIVRHSSYRPS
jgi:hypothetical protein